MPNSQWDVIIVGAGVAGLTAATRLLAQGRSVLILEARDRVGGRVWTRHEPDLPAPIELGPEFIHGRIPETFDLLQEVGKTALDTTGAHWTALNGKLTQRTDMLFEELQSALAQALPQLERQDVPFDRFLSDSTRAGLSSDACRLGRAYVEGFDAADATTVSALSIAQEWQEGGMLDAPQFRPLGGYSSVLRALCGALERGACRIQLQTVVQRVKWARQAVRIDADFLRQPFTATAPKAIITLPLGVLQTDTVQFDPPLQGKQAALAGLASGPVLKVVLRYRQSFWEEIDAGRYADAAFFHAPEQPFPTFWTLKPLRAPILTAWLGGPRAARLAQTPGSNIISVACQSLVSLFGPQAQTAELEAAYYHEWTSDPYARGAYSYVLAGGNSQRQALAEPIQDTLYFAGEATDFQGNAATVTGALHSGARAAHEILSPPTKL